MNTIFVYPVVAAGQVVPSSNEDHDARVVHPCCSCMVVCRTLDLLCFLRVFKHVLVCIIHGLLCGIGGSRHFSREELLSWLNVVMQVYVQPASMAGKACA